MHRQIRRHHRQATRHRLDQRMSKGFGISRGHVNVAGAIEMMKRAIGNRSEFDDCPGLPRRSFTSDAADSARYDPGFSPELKSAGKKEFHLLSVQTDCSRWALPGIMFRNSGNNCSGLQKASGERLRLVQAGFCMQSARAWQSLVKAVPIKSMVHRQYIPATPLAKFLGKRFTRGNGNVGAAYGSPCQPALDYSVRPISRSLREREHREGNRRKCRASYETAVSAGQENSKAQSCRRKSTPARRCAGSVSAASSVRETKRRNTPAAGAASTKEMFGNSPNSRRNRGFSSTVVSASTLRAR